MFPSLHVPVTAGLGLLLEDARGVLYAGVVDGTFIWTPSHDQRPRSLFTSPSFVAAILSSRNRGPGGAPAVKPGRRIWTVGGQWN
jgi:hypothetical protein